MERRSDGAISARSERQSDAVALLLGDGVWTDARATSGAGWQTQVATATVVVGAGVRR